jgi:TP901 family phage tail tape measure protein
VAGKFSVEGVFKMTDRMTRPIAKMETRFDSMMRKMGSSANAFSARSSRMFSAASKGLSAFQKQAREPLAAIGGDLKTMGTAAVAAGAAVGAGLVQVMRSGMDFEKTLLSAGNKFEPGIKKTSEAYKRLSSAAQEVGGNTEFSSSQAALALKELAGAGFGVEQAIAALPGTVNLATAAELDLAGATEVAAKSLGAFGMKSKDPAELAKNLQRVSDVLMKTDDVSSTNIPAIFEAMKEGGPIAKSAGASLETFMSMVAQLGEAGIEGSNAGTTLKNMFLSLQAPTSEAAAQLAKLGIKAVDSKGNLRDMFDILADLNKTTAKMGSADKAGALEAIFGKIPIAGVNNLLDTVDELRVKRDKLEKSGGQVNMVAESKRQSTGGSWDNLTSGLEAISLAIFEVVGGPMKDLIDGTTEWIGTFKGDAIPFVKEFVGGLKDGFAQAWPAIKAVIDMLFTGFGGKTEWQANVRNFATILGKVAAGAVAVAAVLGGMLLAGIQVVTWQINFWIAAWNGVIGAIGGVLFAITNFLANAAAKWRAFNFADWGMQIVRGIAEGIKSGASFVLDAITGLADDMVNKLKGALDMRSPSRRTALVGEGAAEGVGVGWQDKMPDVNAGIARSIDASPMVQPLAPRPFEMPAINALSLGSDGERPLAPTASVMSPEETALAASGGDDLGSAEIVIRDETGRAEVTKAPEGRRLSLTLKRSGEFTPSA